MLQKTRGIVLHYIKYGETSVISHIYTESYGRLSFIINRVRSKKSLNHLSYFQPLTILDLECYYKSGRDLQRIKEVRNNILLLHIQNDVYKNAIGLFIAEILYKTLHETESNRTMFEFLVNAIQLLDIMKEGIPNFHLVFLIQYSKYLGIFPQHSYNVTGNEEEIKEKMLYYSDNHSVFNDMPQALKSTFKELNNQSFQDLSKIKINHNPYKIF